MAGGNNSGSDQWPLKSVARKTSEVGEQKAKAKHKESEWENRETESETEQLESDSGQQTGEKRVGGENMREREKQWLDSH